MRGFKNLKKKTIPDRWFYFSILLFGGYFLYRIFDQSRMVKFFPLDVVNDLALHMAELFLLFKCGFHNFCSYWLNGFVMFLYYPPGWHFFTLPLYLITKNILFTTFISIILMFLLGFLFLWFFGKSQGFSITQRIVFFLFLFANPMSIGNFIRLGRVTEMFGWVFFILLFALILKYKDQKLDWKFIFLIPIYAVLMISHFGVLILIQFTILSLFLVKDFREKVFIVLAMFGGLALSAFWWLPFLLSSSITEVASQTMSTRLFDFSGEWLLTNIATLIVIPVLLVSFYFYWLSSKKSKKELLFFSPVLLLGILFLFRLAPFIPILKHVDPDPFMMYSLFYILYFIFKTRFDVFTPIMKKGIFLLLIVLPILSLIVSIAHTSFFVKHTSLEEETLSVLPLIEDRFLLLKSPSSTSFDCAYYSYGMIYYNLSTPKSLFGWDYPSTTYYNNLNNVSTYLDNKNCNEFVRTLRWLNTSSVVTYDGSCDVLKSCGLNEVVKKERVCLYNI